MDEWQVWSKWPVGQHGTHTHFLLCPMEAEKVQARHDSTLSLEGSQTGPDGGMNLKRLQTDPGGHNT